MTEAEKTKWIIDTILGTSEEERLEKRSWIVQVFDPKPPTARKGLIELFKWRPVHFKVMEENKVRAFIMEKDEDATQFGLERAVALVRDFCAGLRHDPKNAWADFDWAVFNFRTKERIVVSAL